MKHLRLFKTEAEYSSATLELPNVSYVEGTDDVKFNPYTAPASPNVVCTYNVTDISQKTGILNKNGLSHVTNMIVDGVEMDIDCYYQFDTVGNHVVEFVLYDPTSIGNAFSYCTGLTSITIPDTVTSIGDSAFYQCSGMKGTLIIPDSVTSIGKNAFRNCSGLTSITIPDTVTSIGDSAFRNCTGLTGITIPDSVTYIGDSVFYQCSGLTEVTIPDSVTYIWVSAFRNCSGLTSITIPDTVTSIGNYAFSGCSGLTGITIPDTVTSIGQYAFQNCSGLTSVVIGSGVKTIGDHAFDCCSGLTEIICNATNAPSIQSSTFSGVKSGGTLYVPAGSDYSSWMSTGNYYLGKYNWTI